MRWNPFRRRTISQTGAKPATQMRSLHASVQAHGPYSRTRQPMSRRQKLIVGGVAVGSMGLVGFLWKVIGLGPRPHPPIVIPGNGHTIRPNPRQPLPRITPARIPEPIPERETPEQRVVREQAEALERARIENQRRIQEKIDNRKNVKFFNAVESWNGLTQFAEVYTKKKFEYELDANGFPSKPAWVLGDGNPPKLVDGSVIAIKRVTPDGEEATYMMYHATNIEGNLVGQYYYISQSGEGKHSTALLNDFLALYKDGNAQVVGIFNPKN